MKKRTLPWLAYAAVVLVALVGALQVGAQTYATKVHTANGGNKLVVESGGTIDVLSGGSLSLASTAITASAAELNALASTGLSATELGFLNTVVAGTATASKAAVLGTNKNLDTLVLADGGLFLGAGAGTSVSSSAAELNLIDGSLAGTAVASKAAVLGASKDLDTLHITGNLTTASGVGAVAGAGVALVEVGDGAVHKTIFTLTSVSITVTDSGGAGGGSGGIKIYDFPEGVIVRGGCVAAATTLAGAGGIADGGAVVLGLGSAVAAADDSLTSTEADFIASFAGTLTAGAGAFTKYGEPSVTSLDGHTTAKDLYINMAVPDADISSSDTLAVSGTITCIWSNSGDFT